MRGAVNYIVALVLGVAVIALLGYWFFYAGGKGREGTNEAECITEKTRFCAIQSEEYWQKMKDKCGSNVFQIKTDPKTRIKDYQCLSFCSTIIPGWSAIPSNTHEECKKST